MEDWKVDIIGKELFGGQGKKSLEAIYASLKELQNWKHLAACLFDHTKGKRMLFLTPISSVSQAGALEKRGVGALELVAMDMKARGMYVCRTLSYKGAEFDVVEVPLESDMAAWQALWARKQIGLAV
eukprot:Gb_10956 [translate_table: standard]